MHWKRLGPESLGNGYRLELLDTVEADEDDLTLEPDPSAILEGIVAAASAARDFQRLQETPSGKIVERVIGPCDG